MGQFYTVNHEYFVLQSFMTVINNFHINALILLTQYYAQNFLHVDSYLPNCTKLGW